jgi:[protein-PII] uridylyltransferase
VSVLGAGRPEDTTARFRAERAALLATPGRPSTRGRTALTALTDEWLTALFDASGAREAGASLVAVGGHGRRELSAGSDLDLLLLHPGDHISAVADRIWYPIWDSGLRLDHSVRTMAQARRLAASDVRVVLGLLDARTVAGPPEQAEALKSSVLADWRALSARRLEELSESVAARRKTFGELPHLLEPDIKEAYGGLRDLVVLRAVAAAWVGDAPHGTLVAPRDVLLDVRDALHRVASRPTDRLTAQEQGPAAAVLALPDPDALLRSVSAAGRTIAVASDEVWYEVGRLARSRPRLGLKRLTPRGPTRTPLAEGVVLQQDEAVLAADARPDRDPVLVLRAAAVAAQSGVRLSRHAVARLAAESAPMPVPWPATARDALTSLLGAGRAAIPVWEALDQAGIIAALIPHWEVVRSAPQHNPVHKHTVDRHLLETPVLARDGARTVSRPDLLLLGALLHDIGKGRPGTDHCVVGAGLAAEIATHLGYGEQDVATLTRLVRHHLLLPETATRRDPDDPATVAAVVAEVGSTDFLDLLAALTQADALATGPLAWTPWKRSLVTELVARAGAELAGTPVPAPPRIAAEHAALLAGDGVRVLMRAGETGTEIAVAAPDRVGLLGLVAGVLAMHRLEVRSAVTESVGGAGIAAPGALADRAIEVWKVQPLFGDPPEVDRLREDIRRALAGQLDVTGRLARRERDAARQGSSGQPQPVPAVVEVIAGASARATVLEVRAHDAPGLLHRIGMAIAATGTDIIAARVATMGSEAVDVFYLVDRRGDPLAPALAQAVADTVSAALAET